MNKYCWRWVVITLLLAILLSVWLCQCQMIRELKAQEMPVPAYGFASWYSVESCKREGTSGIMSNGEVYDENKLVAASWDYDFGTKVEVINLANNKKVIVEIKDRGPAKRLVKQGRIIDLSKMAFSQLAKLEKGVIRVKVEVIKKD